jgi:hypothetical protein
MYANPSPKEESAQDTVALVDQLVDAFRKEHPAVKVYIGDPLPTSDKTVALVRRFSGDEHGNYEAAAYINSKTVLVQIVLSSRNEQKFKESYKAFEAVVSKYTYVSAVVMKP